jgi:hypothetical protein
MAIAVVRVAGLMLVTVLLAACADRVIQLHYVADSQIQPVPNPQAITVFRFVDARGDEGDQGDALRVGGVYGGYGNRIAKIKAQTPWPDTLVEALTAGFTQRGMQATPMPATAYAPGTTAVATPFALGGEIRNFSTEVRWTVQAHVSGIARLYDQQGRLLVEKRISARVKEPVAGYVDALLNAAIAQFVREVVLDPEISQRLVAAPVAGGRP